MNYQHFQILIVQHCPCDFRICNILGFFCHNHTICYFPQRSIKRISKFFRKKKNPFRNSFSPRLNYYIIIFIANVLNFNIHFSLNPSVIYLTKPPHNNFLRLLKRRPVTQHKLLCLNVLQYIYLFF